MKAKPVAAKSASNTARNQSKVTRKRSALNRNRPALLGLITGVAPVLDLLHLGGPERRRVLRPVSGLRHPVSAAEFHNRVAAAFKAAGL